MCQYINISSTNILLTECSSGFLHFLLFVICLEPLWVVSFRAEKGLIQLNWLNLYFRKKNRNIKSDFFFLIRNWSSLCQCISVANAQRFNNNIHWCAICEYGPVYILNLVTLSCILETELLTGCGKE